MNYERFKQVVPEDHYEMQQFRAYCRNRKGSWQDLFPGWWEHPYVGGEIKKTAEEYDRLANEHIEDKDMKVELHPDQLDEVLVQHLMSTHQLQETTAWPEEDNAELTAALLVVIKYYATNDEYNQFIGEEV